MSGDGLASLNENDYRSSVWFARWRCIPTCITKRTTQKLFHPNAVAFRDVMFLILTTAYWGVVFLYEYYSNMNRNVEAYNSDYSKWVMHLKASKGDLESACSSHCNNMIYVKDDCTSELSGNQYHRAGPVFGLYLSLIGMVVLGVWFIGLFTLCTTRQGHPRDINLIGPEWLLMTLAECTCLTLIPAAGTAAVVIGALIEHFWGNKEDLVCKAACNGCAVSEDADTYPDHWFPELNLHAKLLLFAIISAALPIFNAFFHQYLAKPTCDLITACKCLPDSTLAFAGGIVGPQVEVEENRRLLDTQPNPVYDPNNGL